jgi:hypothetical protein
MGWELPGRGANSVANATDSVATRDQPFLAEVYRKGRGCYLWGRATRYDQFGRQCYLKRCDTSPPAHTYQGRSVHLVLRMNSTVRVRTNSVAATSSVATRGQPALYVRNR